MINFFTEAVDFDRDDFHKIKDWIKKIVKEDEYNIGYINFIFTNDNYLLDINKKFLKRNDYTDIITFPYSKGKELEADIYISIERIKDNAKSLNIEFENELLRVIIHGILHLMEYDDTTQIEKDRMRKKETECILKWYSDAGKI